LGAQAFGKILKEIMLIPSRLSPSSLDSDPCFSEVGEDKETKTRRQGDRRPLHFAFLAKGVQGEKGVVCRERS